MSNLELSKDLDVKKLNARWLGRVSLSDSLVLQDQLVKSEKDYLLIQEHTDVYTLGSLSKAGDELLPDAYNYEIVNVDRGGKVTYHGPGQLVVYPVISLPELSNGMSDGAKYAHKLEQVVINLLAKLGVEAIRRAGFPGVWANEQKICAIGSKVVGGRSKHGFAINVSTDLAMFNNIIACGIDQAEVTSIKELLADTTTESSDEELLKKAIDLSVEEFSNEFGFEEIDFASSAWRKPEWNLENINQMDLLKPNADNVQLLGPAPSLDAAQVMNGSSTRIQLKGKLAQAGVATDTNLHEKRPDWMKIKATNSKKFLGLKKLVKEEKLHTVCEEAGCPNINECWSSGTATFMILGSRCTRACSFCLIDTRKPLAPDEDEPKRVGESVAKLDLKHAVITCVTRDDLEDGGARIFAETIRQINIQSPKTRVEVLISDCKGDEKSLQTIYDAKPDVLNHNIETVLRLQRAMRTSANYARSFAVLARARKEGLITKTGLILGLGETDEEIYRTIDDCVAFGVQVLTIGQYLRPTTKHAPVVKWYTPEEFNVFRDYGYKAGLVYVESGPLVRSSYHASDAVDAALGEKSKFENLFKAQV